jgi:hypothetical protein
MIAALLHLLSGCILLAVSYPIAQALLFLWARFRA